LLNAKKIVGDLIMPHNSMDFPSAGYAEFRLLCPLVLYTVLVQASMLVAGIFLGKERMEYVERERPDFGQVMMEATFLLTVLYIFLSAAASLPESKTKARYISSWTDYQVRVDCKVGIVLNYTSAMPQVGRSRVPVPMR
jgi:hypothetical protein